MMREPFGLEDGTIVDLGPVRQKVVLGVPLSENEASTLLAVLDAETVRANRWLREFDQTISAMGTR